MPWRNASIQADLLEAANQLLERVDEQEIAVKFLGGLAFKLICPSSAEGSLSRDNNDIDLAVRRKDVSKLKKLMETMGYEYPLRSNALHPDQILYVDNQNKRQVDIFVDGFQMCHKLDFRHGLEDEGPTLPITELLMTKLQIAEITDKDLRDIGAALFDFEIGSGKHDIHDAQITNITSTNWGVWKDFTGNLMKLKNRITKLAPDKAEVIALSADSLLGLIAARPKSARWQIRARIGERMQWHELPQQR